MILPVSFRPEILARKRSGRLSALAAPCVAAVLLAHSACAPAVPPGYDDSRGLAARLGAVTLKSAEQAGAKGDGQTDDTAALQAWLSTPHAILQLSPGKTYKITHSLVLGAGTGIVGYGTRPGRLLMSASGFNCDAAAGCANYITDPHAAGIVALGKPGSPLDGLVLDHFAIVGEGAAQQGKTLMAISCRNVVGLRIARLDISNLTNAIGVRCSGLSGNSSIESNTIHDFHDDSPGPLPNLMAGILIDGDTNGKVASTTKLAITNNTVANIRYGAAFTAKYQQQSSGIVVITGATGVIASGNVVEGTGQGIDWHGSNGQITRNIIRQSDLFCFKLAHGAANNLVAGNTLNGCGIAGIELSGGTKNRSVTNNRIVGNTISGIDPNNLYSKNNNSAGIRMDKSTPGSHNIGNIIKNNTITLGRYGRYLVSDLDPGDTGNVISGTRFNAPGLSGMYNIQPGTSSVQ